MPSRRALAFVFAVALGAGCEVIVPSGVDAIHCTGTDPSACPPGQVCVPASGQCIPWSRACTTSGCASPLTCDPNTQQCVSVMVGPDGSPVEAEASPGSDVMSPMDSTPPPDTRTNDAPPADAGCGGVVGCPCTVPTDCTAPAFCAPPAVLPGGGGSMCSRTCCKSSDCPAGSVCYGSGGPGNFCVPAAMIRSDRPGSGGPGAPCSSNSDCRSAVCAGIFCQDTCCSDSDCGIGTFCALSPTPVDNHYSFICLPNVSGSGPGSTCSNNSSCNSDVCVGECRPHCCGESSCSGLNFGACEVVGISMTNDSVLICTYFGNTPTGTGFGTSCTTNTDCQSRMCNTTSHTCTTPCCLDSDCMPGQVCRPDQGSPPYLLCVTGG